MTGLFSRMSMGMIMASMLLPAGGRAQPPTYLNQWTLPGGGDPYYLATDANDRIYVTDPTLGRVLVFTNTGAYLTQWGAGRGNANGQFEGAFGLAVAPNGNVYVADAFNNRVQVFTGSGTYLSQWGTAGVGDGEFLNTFDVAIAASGEVYVTDYRGDRVQVFTSDGTYLRQWRTDGNATGIEVDPAGEVFVATGNSKIQVFTGSGTLLRQWGEPGTGSGQFSLRPYGLALAANGNVYVADRDNNRVQVFTRNGQYLTQWGTYGQGNGEFWGPSAVVVDQVGSVFVADLGNSRIQKFGALLTTVSGTSWGRIKALYRRR